MNDECPVCYGPCDAEIHEATLRVRAWLRDRVRLSLAPLVTEAHKPRRMGVPANKREDLSPGAMAKMRCEGHTLAQIAAHCHCSVAVVTDRLHLWRAGEDRRRSKVAQEASA